jgi:xanthine dehydrogenase accessory factor
MRELLPVIETWCSEGIHVARAVVIRTYGSAPRREGATLLRAADGRLEGSVSGGCVEGATAEHVEAAVAAGQQRVVRFGISDAQAWGVGLACGGTIDVLVQPHIPTAALEAARATSADRRASRVVVSPLPEGSPAPAAGTSLSGPAAAVEEALVVHEDGRLEGSLGAAEADAALVEASLASLSRGTSRVLELGGRQYLIESYPGRPRLVAVGAVAVAASLVRFARDLGYETVVIDGRPAFATRERFPDVDELIVGWPDEVADDIELGGADAVAVLSHDPKFDEPAIAEALRRGCRYVGAIGSRKTQRARRERLRQRGLSDEQLDRLRGPIGLDLGGREPAETALSVMAEIVAARYEASARPMRDGTAERRGSG